MSAETIVSWATPGKIRDRRVVVWEIKRVTVTLSLAPFKCYRLFGL